MSFASNIIEANTVVLFDSKQYLAIGAVGPWPMVDVPDLDELCHAIIEKFGARVGDRRLLFYDIDGGLCEIIHVEGSVRGIMPMERRSEPEDPAPDVRGFIERRRRKEREKGDK